MIMFNEAEVISSNIFFFFLGAVQSTIDYDVISLNFIFPFSCVDIYKQLKKKKKVPTNP
jgi:hypothetical protein